MSDANQIIDRKLKRAAEQKLDAARLPILSSEVFKVLKERVLLFAKTCFVESDLEFFERETKGAYSRHHSLIGSETLYEFGLRTEPKTMTDYTKYLQGGHVVDPSENYWSDLPHKDLHQKNDNRYVTVPSRTIGFNFLANGEFELLSRNVQNTYTSYGGGKGAYISRAESIHQGRYLPITAATGIMR